MGPGLEFKPRIVGFLCNWCCYAGADLCGVSRYQYPPNIRVIRLMCSGRVDPAFIFRAFSNGTDGVFIGGCWLGECHYLTEGRLRLEWVSAAEGIRFAEVQNDFTEKLKRMGPLGKGEGIDEKELKSKLEEVSNLIPYIKQMKREKLAVRLEKEEDYSELYTLDEVETLFREVVSYYIDPDLCQACMICLRKCPEEGIIGGKNQIHVIDQNVCLRCGNCYEVCPPKFGAVKKFIGEPVPPPLPEEERTLVRAKK